MSRSPVPAATATVLALALALAGCTAAPTDTSPGPAATADAPAPGAGAGTFPGCAEITTALGDLVDGLTYSEESSTTNTADEAYEQRVCVYVTDDAAAELGITIAAIPFQQPELDAYATLPNAITDSRLEPFGGVLQTFVTGDGDDGHLDGALYLIDTQRSITVQGVGTAGSTADSLPQLTVMAATDAAFAVRALVD